MFLLTDQKGLICFRESMSFTCSDSRLTTPWHGALAPVLIKVYTDYGGISPVPLLDVSERGLW